MRRLEPSDVAGLIGQEAPTTQEIRKAVADLKRQRRRGCMAGSMCRVCERARAVMLAAGLWEQCQ